MPKWPVTVAFTDAEAEALERVAEAEFDGDKDAAVRSMLDAWLGDGDGGTSRFKR